MTKSCLIRFSVVLGIIWLALSLSGCLTTAKNIKNDSELIQAEKDRSIVFGQIEWLEKGKEKKIGKGLLSMALAPHLMKMEDKTRIVGEVSEGGQFVWSLKAGSYLIHKIAYRDPWSGNYFFVPKTAFNVPQNGGVYYIGTLQCEFEPSRDLIGGLSGNVKFTIQDEFDRDVSDFQERLSIASKEIEKSLMVHDIRLPRTIETTAEFNLAVNIINAILFGISQ